MASDIETRVALFDQASGVGPPSPQMGRGVVLVGCCKNLPNGVEGMKARAVLSSVEEGADVVAYEAKGESFIAQLLALGVDRISALRRSICDRD